MVCSLPFYIGSIVRGLGIVFLLYMIDVVFVNVEKRCCLAGNKKGIIKKCQLQKQLAK